MTIDIEHDFTFEAAHFLPRVPADHKCRRMHGHSYRVRVVVRGDLDPELGWLVDFAEVKHAVAPIRDRLDHYLLNEIEGLENPTAENLAVWIWERLAPAVPLLAEVRVAETCNNAVVYRGPSVK